MRTDNPTYALANASRERNPRYVIGIIFDTGSLYFASHDDISGVPTLVTSYALLKPSVVSQKLNPEQGRAEIGSASFSLVDRGAAITDAFRTKLNAGAGLRFRTVKFWDGFEGMAFSDFTLQQTQIITGVRYEDGQYDVTCSDIQRSMKKDIFDLATTTLSSSISESDTTISVASTTEFELCKHGTTYGHLPSTTVGYLMIGKEIISYTGKTSTTFTGCSRGVLGTRPQAFKVDGSVPPERREKVTEHVYLELPAPKLIYALLTGVLYGDAANLPARWHLGIPTTWVRLSDFTDIGAGLWDLSDETKSLVVRFLGQTKTDGKAFIEKELLLAMGAFMPVGSDGSLGLRLMSRVLRSAPAVLTLDETNVISVDALDHDLDAVANVIRVDWNWTGKEFTRQHFLVDAASIATHGETTPKVLAFKGFYGSRATDVAIRTRAESYRDRIASPPQRTSVEVLQSLNPLEPGDIVRLKLKKVRDFAGPSGGIDRAFEVQQKSYTPGDGVVRLELFGSTASARQVPAGSSTPPLPDAFYTSAGTALSAVSGATLSGNTLTGFSSTFAGGTDINASGSIIYHNGDLTIDAAVALNFTGNLQLRVKGFLTINGFILSYGGGKAGVADDSGTEEVDGTPGYVGNTRGWDGQQITQRTGNPIMGTRPAKLTRGKYDQAPQLELAVSGSTIVGLPTDLRGGGGGPGGKLNYLGSRLAAAGSGGNGGGGLMIVCRGLAVGVAGRIELTGNNGSLGAYYDNEDKRWYAGSGAGGGPGSLLLLLDGSSLAWPDLEGKFVAKTGITPTPFDATYGIQRFLDAHTHRYNRNEGPYAGYADPSVISEQDLSFSALRIQYIPDAQTAVADTNGAPPAPTALTATGQIGQNWIQPTLPAFDRFDEVEIWAAASNDRTTAGLIGRGKTDSFVHPLPGGAVRYYWSRTVRYPTDGSSAIYSDWLPSSSTGGISATAGSPAGGTPGDSVIYEYSVDGSTGWHSTFTAGDLYARHKVGTGGTFTAAYRIVGEQGTPGGTGPTGNFIDRVFKQSATTPATPTGATPAGWTDAPTDDLSGNPVWMSEAEKTSAGALVGVWSAPIQISGIPARLITLEADAQIFRFDKDGNPSPTLQTINFTVKRQNVTGAASFSSTPSVGLTGSGDTRSLTVANFGANQSVKVTATIGSFSDEITVVRVQDGPQGGAGAPGAAALTGFLTNESHTVPADADGNVLSFAGASGNFRVFQGAVDVTGSCTFATQSASGISTGSIGSGGAYSVSAMTADVGTITFRATYTPTGATLDKVFNVTKSRAGVPASTNLLRVDRWTAGAYVDHNQGGFIRNGNTGENAIVLAPGPSGMSQLVWECRPSGDGVGDGGWDNVADLVGKINSKRTYRSRVWIWVNELVGNVYHGCDYSFTRNLDGSPNTNPYFLAANWGTYVGLVKPGQWYLSVGFIHGEDYAGTHTRLGGLYDPATGAKLVDYDDFKLAPGATQQNHRAYHYYNTSGSPPATRQRFLDPAFEEVGPSIATIADLLSVGGGFGAPGPALNADPYFTNPAAWEVTNAIFQPIIDGVAGQNVLRGFGGALGLARSRIPIDPTKTYRVRGIMRSVAAGGIIYCGVDAQDGNGAVISVDGTFWFYGAASGVAVPGTFTTYEAQFGAGTSRPFPVNARWMRPLAFLNYSGSVGYVECNYLAIEEVTATSGLAPGSVSQLAQQTLDPNGSGFGGTFDILTYTFTPSVDCVLTVITTLDLAMTFDWDSGCGVVNLLLNTTDSTSALGQGRASRDRSGAGSMVRTTYAMNDQFSLLGGKTYDLRLRQFRAAGSSAYWNIVRTILINKR